MRINEGSDEQYVNDGNDRNNTHDESHEHETTRRKQWQRYFDRLIHLLVQHVVEGLLDFRRRECRSFWLDLVFQSPPRKRIMITHVSFKVGPQRHPFFLGELSTGRPTFKKTCFYGSWIMDYVLV